MQKIRRFLLGWNTTYRQQGCIGKIILVIFSFTFLFCLCVFPIAVLSPTTPTSTPEIKNSINQIVVMTAHAAQTQTQVQMTFTTQVTEAPTSQIIGTSTFTPTVTSLPTGTNFIFLLQTNVAQTQIIYNTSPPVVYYTMTPFVLVTQSHSDNCNPSYPTVCVNGSPRFNCEELRKKGIYHFTVLSPDPLGYDRDGDGIGCE